MWHHHFDDFVQNLCEIPDRKKQALKRRPARSKLTKNNTYGSKTRSQNRSTDFNITKFSPNVKLKPRIPSEDMTESIPQTTPELNTAGEDRFIDPATAAQSIRTARSPVPLPVPRPTSEVYGSQSPAQPSVILGA